VAPPAQPADRYEPLPGLLGLPGFLLRKLSPPARKILLAVLALLGAAGVVAVIVFGPRIAESNRERAAEQRRAERQAQAAELARLRAEQRPRTGTIAAGGAIPGVETAITRDARARLDSGELPTRALRTDCRPVGHDAAERVLLSCTAVTSDVPATETTRGVLIGYPYRAAVAPASGRYALCKISGRPGEGSLTRRVEIPLPKACGG
jgi:type II secretory pathway pseudopilin PulG